MPDATLADAVILLRQYQERMAAEMIVMEAVEAAGDIAALVHELEQERDLLEIEVATLRQERQRAAGGPGKEETT